MTQAVISEIRNHLQGLWAMVEKLEATQEAKRPNGKTAVARVQEAMERHQERAIHYKKLAKSLGMDHGTVAVSLFSLKAEGLVENTKRGYYKAKV